MIYTSSLLVQTVKQKSAMTTGQMGLSDNDILAIATRRLKTDIVADILNQGEEYLEYVDTIPLVSNQSYYRIPDRAIGQVIRHVYLNYGGTRISISKVDDSDLESFNSTGTTTMPYNFTIEGNYVRFLPSIGTISNSTSMDLYYFMNPNVLTIESNCRQIVSINPAYTQFTIASTPSNFTPTLGYDFINHISGNEIINYNQICTSIATNVMVFPTPQTDVSVGDWICLAGQSPVPNIPELWQDLLVSLTVSEIQQLKQNTMGIQIATAETKRLTDAIDTITSQRVISKPDRVIPRSPLNLPRGGSRMWRF